MLGASEEPLCERYDLAMFDLDGVIYVGGDPVPGAAEHVAQARSRGQRVAFITNNASRPATAVAEHLTALGVEATADDVVTSAQAAARVLLDRDGEGAEVLVLGGDGLREAVGAVGLTVVEPERLDGHEPVSVVTGYGPDVRWSQVMQAAVRIRGGLPWVATNTDATIPTAFGVAPGHGVLVDLLRRFAEVEPVVAGKPERPLLDETVRRVGGRRPLMVGDRLDTDIEGGRRAGVDTLLVLTGVSGLDELVAAGPDERPTYVAPDLGGLLVAHPAPTETDGAWRCGGWTARVDDGALGVEGDGDATDWWRVAAAAAWQHLDRAGAPVDTQGLRGPTG